MEIIVKADINISPSKNSDIKLPMIRNITLLCIYIAILSDP